MSTLFDNQKAQALEQQMELFRTAEAMLHNGTPEWLAFLQLVKDMRAAQRKLGGVAYSKIKCERAELPVDNLIRELGEVEVTPVLDFTRLGQLAEGGAA